jgi:adenylate cyclase
MFTDMVGYTTLGQKNEALSLALVEEQRKVIRPILKRHSGREVKTIGDAFLVEFPNAVDAVRCAYDIQRAVREFNFSLASDKRIHLRVGVHVGEVIEAQGDISGDAVNVASRIEPLAEDGGVCVTRQVYDLVRNNVDIPLSSLGPKPLKNVAEPMEVYRMVLPWGKQETTADQSLDKNRLAVLPFTSMSPEPSDSYFADSITDEIITTVAGISGLSVISRTSVMGYKGTTKRVEEIGRELKVGSILEGSFKRAGNRIRVTAQLIEAAGDKHLWAQNYDRNLDDVFEVQSDIAQQVADALRVKILSPELERIETKPTQNPLAYTLYLRGRHLWSKRGVENIKNAAEVFEQAVKEDPDFAQGYVGWADSCLVLKNWGIDREENLVRARALVTKALELDPSLAEAHVTLGKVLEGEHDLRHAEEEYRKAIELKPGYATAHHWFFLLLLSQLRLDEALEQIEKALDLDPLSPVINYNYGIFYYARRDYAKAVVLFKRVTVIDPAYAPVRFMLSGVYGKTKMFREMREEGEIGAQLFQGSFPGVRLMVEAFYAKYEDDKQALERLLPELLAHAKEPGEFAITIATCYVHTGNADEAFEWLERAYSGGADLTDFKYEPDFDPIRTDPRYVDLLKKLGLN